MCVKNSERLFFSKKLVLENNNLENNLAEYLIILLKPVFYI